jgi:hypothetical protein
MDRRRSRRLKGSLRIPAAASANQIDDLDRESAGAPRRSDTSLYRFLPKRPP